MLIGVYSIISPNAFCDLSYTRNILPRVSAGTASKELFQPSAQIPSFLPSFSKVPSTETIYSLLHSRFGGMHLIFAHGTYEDLKPSLFYRFGLFGKPHVPD